MFKIFLLKAVLESTHVTSVAKFTRPKRIWTHTTPNILETNFSLVQHVARVLDSGMAWMIA